MRRADITDDVPPQTNSTGWRGLPQHAQAAFKRSGARRRGFIADLLRGDRLRGDRRNRLDFPEVIVTEPLNYQIPVVPRKAPLIAWLSIALAGIAFLVDVFAVYYI